MIHYTDSELRFYIVLEVIHYNDYFYRLICGRARGVRTGEVTYKLTFDYATSFVKSNTVNP